MTAHATRSRVLAAVVAALALVLPGAAAQETPIGSTTTSVTLEPAAPALEANNTTALNVTISYTYMRAAALGAGASTDVEVTANVTGPLNATPANATITVPIEAGTLESNTTTALVNLTLACSAAGSATLTVTARAAANGLLGASEGTATASVRCLEPPPPPPTNATNATNATGNITGNMTGNATGRGNGTLPPLRDGNGTALTGQPSEEQGRLLPPAPAALVVVAALAVGLVLRRRQRPG